jgi:LacI family transcriptional regulator
MSKEIGIKEIAELTGVSIGTVDRVIHGRPGVSNETAALIRNVIQKTGYKKNNAASRLKLAHSKTIRIAVLFPIECRLSDNYWSLPLSGVQKAVNELKDFGITYSLLTFKMSNEKSYEKQIQFILKNNFDAIITVPFFYAQSQILLKEAIKKQMRVIFIDTQQDFQENHYVIHQNSLKSGAVAGRLLYQVVGDKGSYLVVNLMNNLGTIQNNMKNREAGFRSFFESQASSKATIQSVISTSKNLSVVRNKVNELLDLNKPIGIFVTNSRIHLLFLALEGLPSDTISIVGYDLNEKNKALLKEEKIHFLLNQQPQWQGYNAAKGIFKLLTERDASALQLEIPVEIFVKENI